MLAAYLSCLRGLDGEGIRPEVAAGKMVAVFGAGPRFFMEAAKFRAARMLLSSLLTECGVPPDRHKVHLLGRTGTWNKTLLDPHVNILRAVTETLSMVFGGCDTIATGLFNERVGGDSFAARIAQNIQILLKEESHLDEVVDPGGGSYHLESITAELCDRAWACFQDIEREGGLGRALEKGSLQEMVRETVAKRKKEIGRRKEVLVGTSMYVDIAEPLSRAESRHLEQNSIEPFVAGAGYEELRTAADMYRAAHGHLPRAFLLTMGPLAQHKARADFSRSVLEPGGFEVVYPNGFSCVEEAVAAAEASGAELYVLCSTDESYPDLVPSVGAALKQSMPGAYLVLAGFPEEHVEAFKAAGIDELLHVRADNLSLLRTFQQKTGVAR